MARLAIPYAGIPQATMVTKVILQFLTQSLLLAESFKSSRNAPVIAVRF
jgi:hypothetical protein